MQNKDQNKDWWRPAVTLFAKTSGSVAIPVIIALYVGKYFDDKYHTEPWIFLSLTAIAFIVSIFLIWKNIKPYLEEQGEEDEIEKKDKAKQNKSDN